MKKEKTALEIYESNKRASKWIGWLSPIVFWGLLGVFVLLFVLSIANSFGNVNEVLTLLDSKQYTGAELQANYNYLIEKYGEWRIGNGGAYFSMTFINIKAVVFSGIMITEMLGSFVALIGAFLLGKWFLPRLSKQLTENNQDMVNETILKKEESK